MILNFSLVYNLHIYVRVDITLGICFVLLTSYYLFKSKSKYKWVKIVSIALLIPLTLSINAYIRKDELIKDRGLEKRIKDMLQTNYATFEEELTVSNMQKINKLYIVERDNVNDLQGIEQLNNLEELDIDSEGVKNLEALGMLINLKELTISDDNLYRLERIMGLESLEKLRLSYVKINKGASIDNLCGLKELSIHKAKFKDLSFVKELKEIEELSLSGCTIESLEGVEYLSNLKRLEIDHAGVKDINKIKELKSLEELELCESEVGDIDKLQEETDFKIIIKEEDFLDKVIYK